VDVQPEWVRGHAGDPMNELADRLSKLGARNGSVDDLDSAGNGAPSPSQDLSELLGVVPRGDWEQGFVRSIRDQLRRGRSLSPKQQAVIDRIRARGAETP
jgi:hypothetical protein